MLSAKAQRPAAHRSLRRRKAGAPGQARPPAALRVARPRPARPPRSPVLRSSSGWIAGDSPRPSTSTARARRSRRHSSPSFATRGRGAPRAHSRRVSTAPRNRASRRSSRPITESRSSALATSSSCSRSRTWAAATSAWPPSRPASSGPRESRAWHSWNRRATRCASRSIRCAPPVPRVGVPYRRAGRSFRCGALAASPAEASRRMPA